MIDLVRADLLRHRTAWAWTLLVVVVGAACGAGVLTSISTALAHVGEAGAPDAREGLEALGANVVLWTLASAAGVVGASASLVMSSQAREHALWVVLGVPRHRVRLVLLGQLAALGAAGGLLGYPVSLAVAAVALGQWSSLGLAPAGLAPDPSWWHLPAAVALGVSSCLWGGWGTARRASRAPEMTALRDAVAPRAHVGWVKVLLALMVGDTGIALIGVALTHELGGPEDRAAAAVSAWLCIVAGALLVGAWTLRPLLWVWTALVPVADPAWHLARESCRHRSSQSITTVLPFALALSLLGVLIGGGNVFGGEVSVSEVLVLLGWVLLVAWTGGIAVIALVGRQRGRDAALIAVAGADRSVLVRTTLCEGLVYALTAVLFGLLTLLGAVVTTALAGDVPLPTALSRAPWGLFAGVALATAATTCLAVALAARRAARASVVETLRL